jgi:hypothetical protein
MSNVSIIVRRHSLPDCSLVLNVSVLHFCYPNIVNKCVGTNIKRIDMNRYATYMHMLWLKIP